MIKNKKIIVGIDASRNRSGGAKAHVIGLINEGNPIKYGISEIHIWAPKSLLDSLNDQPWLFKHCPEQLEKSLLKQIIWQFKDLNKIAKKIGVDILFATDAGTFCRFKKTVVMSQDMLQYEPGMMKSYGWNKARLRLLLLLYVQNWAMKRSVGVIFLTKYVMEIIQKSTGKLQNTIVIPHGVGQKFKDQSYSPKQNLLENGVIKCVYVSNTEMYKHQWNVVKAIAGLRSNGYSIQLTLVGGGNGKSRELLDQEILNSDPNNDFVEILEFVKADDMPNLLTKFDISIFASSCENLPVTLLESMAVGLPIACSNRGPMPDVLKNSGEYFDPENIKTIENAIEKIIKNDEMRLNYGINAKNNASEYYWEKCSNSTWEFLMSSLNKQTI